MKYPPAILSLVGVVLLIALVGCGGNEESGEHGGSAESSEHGGESGEQHNEGTESAELGEESGDQYGPNDAYDNVRAGARLVIAYDLTANVFRGTVSNTTGETLSRVRVEVHLSNGTELGPTTPVDLAPDQTAPVTLQATAEPFDSWSAHPEVGGGGEE